MPLKQGSVLAFSSMRTLETAMFIWGRALDKSSLNSLELHIRSMSFGSISFFTERSNHTRKLHMTFSTPSLICIGG